ncbi:MAG: hypothetical protein ACLQIB_29180 [Isosphaeraceae bacterium]
MKFSLRFTAMGLAVLSIGWQDAGTQAPTPAVPTKQLPPAQTSLRPPDDVDINRTSQDVPPQSEPAASPLEELAWMVGDWVDQDDDATIESSVNWTKNRKFLTRSFRVSVKNSAPHSGMQLIGWDPAEKTIRSWTYDAEGGFGEERWRRTGDRWTIRTKYTLPDGKLGSATQVMHPIDDKTFTWRSVNRVVGGTLQPDIDEVTVVRKLTAEDEEETTGTREAGETAAEQAKPAAEPPAAPPPVTKPKQENQP